MKSTVVDESLSSFKPMYCSREYQASTRYTTLWHYNTVWILYIKIYWCIGYIILDMYKRNKRRQQGKPLHIVYSNIVHAKQQQQECYIEIWNHVTSLYSQCYLQNCCFVPYFCLSQYYLLFIYTSHIFYLPNAILIALNHNLELLFFM